MKNLKRALSLVLSTAMLVGMMVVGTGATSFKDVDANDNLAAIEVMKAVGVMEGDDAGNFNPDELVTRNEMAVVMTKLLGLKAGGSHPFTDVPAWASDYVAACYANGTVAGTSATTFGGSQTVTASQAALMVMKALGYFGYQGEFGDDWQLATIKMATKIDLFNGMNVYPTEALTRNEVAKLVLNALESEIVVITQQGGLSVEGNGITVNQQPTYFYDYADDRAGHNYDGADSVQQLTEKLFGSDLQKNGNVRDDFERPSTEWTYKETTIKAPKATKLVYTDEVKIKDMYKDLGEPAIASVEYYINGASQTVTAFDTKAELKAEATKIGAKGAVLEVYYDTDADQLVLVEYNYFLAQATEDYDVSDEHINLTCLGNAQDVKAEDFAMIVDLKEDDYVLVTATVDGGWSIKSVAAVDAIKNAVVSVERDGDYVIADGVSYKYAKTLANSSTAVGYALAAGTGSYDINGDGYNLYLDPNGYVLGVEGYDAGVNLDNYVFVKAVVNNGFDGIAKVMLMDGTTKTVVVDKIGSTDVDAANIDNVVTPNKFYTFDTDKNGNYELTEIAVGSNATTGVEQYWGTTAITSAAAPLTAWATQVGTSATTFIAKDDVSVGVKNAPEIASGMVYMLRNDGKLLVVYSATAGSSKTSVDDLVYILNDEPATAKDGDDTYYIYNAVVNGEKTTLDANQNNKAAGIYKIDTITDGRADLGTALTAGDDALVNVLGTISGASYKDGTIVLGSTAYLAADDIQVITVEDNTVKTISVSTIASAFADGFDAAIAIEVSSSNDDIAVLYLIK